MRTGLRRLANRSLHSAPGNGFQEAETGGAETRIPRASAPPETQAFRNRRAKSLNRRAVWQSVQETRWEQSAWWARLDSNQEPDRYERPALTIELRARSGQAIVLEHDAEKWKPLSDEQHAQLIGIDHVHAFGLIQSKRIVM
jgi:hypothetical protein